MAVGEPEASCIFCRIVRGEAPAHLVWQDGMVAAFMDIYPSSRGHVLVVPRRHAVTFWDLTAEEAGAVMQAAWRVAHALRWTLQPAGLNLLQNNGAIAGQQVFHFHLHLIPRYGGGEGLRFRMRGPDTETPSAAALAELAARLRAALEA
ncbi:MAG TPA: HIT family protein [Limnochordales bacterium]